MIRPQSPYGDVQFYRPASAVTTYGDGGAKTEVTGGMDPNAMIQALIDARAERDREARAREYAAKENARKDAVRYKEHAQPEIYMRAPNPGRSETPVDSLAKAQALHERHLEHSAKVNGPTMRAVTGFNQIGGAAGRDVMDVPNMNAFERDMYLPKGSGFERGGLAMSELEDDNEAPYGRDPYGRPLTWADAQQRRARPTGPDVRQPLGTRLR